MVLEQQRAVQNRIDFIKQQSQLRQQKLKEEHQKQKQIKLKKQQQKKKQQQQQSKQEHKQEPKQEHKQQTKIKRNILFDGEVVVTMNTSPVLH